MGLRALGLLITRAVLLVALCGLALGIVGSMSVHRQQYFGAAECGEAVWDVGVGGMGGVWSAVQTAAAGRDLTLMASGPDPGVRHVTGPVAPCLTGADERVRDDLAADRGFLLRDGSVLADRAVHDGELLGRPVVVVPSTQWRGMPSDGVIQPTPAFDDSTSYVGFLVGDPAAMDDFVESLRTADMTVEASPAPSSTGAAVKMPLIGVTSVLTALTLVSVTAYWALTLRTQERPRVRVLRLLGVSPLRGAASRWAASLVPFGGAALVAAVVWTGMSRSGALQTPSQGEAAVVIAAVIAADAVLVAGTHLAALRMRAVPR